MEVISIERDIAYKTIYRSFGLPDYLMEDNIRKYRRILASFTKKEDEFLYRTDRAEICKVLFQGVEWILEEDIYGPNGWSVPKELQKGIDNGFHGDTYSIGKYPSSTEEIVHLVETHIQNVQAEAVEEYEYDPEGYFEYHSSKETPMEHHPWGEDTVKSVRDWMNADPYTWFCVLTSVNTTATYLMEEALMGMARGADDGKGIAEAVMENFSKQMRTFVKRNQA